MGRTANYSRQVCGIAGALEIVGDPWTILILREAVRGVRRFEQWQERLGVARNVLAARLKALVAHGILETRRYSEHPPRQEYALTSKGLELTPVLSTLGDWGNRHVYGGKGPARFVHERCGQPAKAVITCQHCGEGLMPGDLRLVRHTEGAPTVGELLAAPAKA